ncbi:MAG TPA: hypothetical protein VFZ33_01475 [Chitinophagaceae bacterium]
MSYISELADNIIEKFKIHSSTNTFTVGISGIDASGKGYITGFLQKELEKKNYKVANINVDPWQNPIPIRLQKDDPAENFYQNVFRWDNFFTQLIVPLRTNRHIYLQTTLIRTDGDFYYSFIYDFNDIDILLIEGIFLFKQELLNYYDWKIWIDCSFETGIYRAIERNSEKLSREQLIHDYNTYYYPAQIYHFQRDDPKDVSNIIYCNDELLGTVGQLTERQVI